MAEQLTIEVLPAEYGDCLLVECRSGSEAHRVLIDGGPPDTVDSLRKRLQQLPEPAVDLLVVSHLDADHIGGIVELMQDEKPVAQFADIWFNGYKHLPAPMEPDRGVHQALTLTDLLNGGNTGSALPWNIAWKGDGVVRGDDDPKTARCLEPLPEIKLPGGLVITLLSPTPKRLAALRRGWDLYMQKVRDKESSLQAYQGSNRGFETVTDLEQLAATDSKADNTAPNGSSIAFLLEYGGKSCLFAADAFATVVYPALARLAEKRGVRKLEIDAMKVPHHGSQANVLSQLFNVVNAKHYLISTSGARFEHPDDASMARIITRGGPDQTIWFNYQTDRTLRWSSAALCKKYGYNVRYPGNSEGGIVVVL
jgi:beta-lactamase superfamily II metal-dependent hydrolase